MAYNYIVFNNTDADVTLTSSGRDDITVEVHRWKSVPVSYMRSAVLQGLTNLGRYTETSTMEILNWVMGTLMRV
jgi:hypothetical protein